ncbi:hypothetical protein PLESTM_001858900 [Pleodorina starrii]|nr:hypothetical protein PLESTM_001858900 [Pleodorina starrii]
MRAAWEVSGSFPRAKPLTPIKPLAGSRASAPPASRHIQLALPRRSSRHLSASVALTRRLEAAALAHPSSSNINACDGQDVLARLTGAAARIESLISAISSSPGSAGSAVPHSAVPAASRQPAHAGPRALRRELLGSVDSLLGAAADVRSCAALVQAYSRSRESLEAVVQLLAQAAILEDALLSNPRVYGALLPLADPHDTDPSRSSGFVAPSAAGQPQPRQQARPPPRPSPAAGACVEHGIGFGGDASGSGDEDDPRVGRLFAVLAPRFLREGYHPTDPRVAYSVALSREEKVAMLADTRRRERFVLAALRRLLGSGGGGSGSGGGDPEAAAAPSLIASDPAAAAAAGGDTSSYDWPSYELTAEELAEDAVLAEVVAAQWGVRCGGGGGGGERGDGCEATDYGGGQGGDAGGGGGGGSLVLTLDACGALLQRHPDPVLRQQVYDEGLAPLATHALDLLQHMRDLRAQQAALYGLYDTDDAAGTAGYGGLAHLDSLARDGRAAAAFLTSLAEALEPLVREQLQQLTLLAAKPGSETQPGGPLDSGSFEHLLRAQAWGHWGSDCSVGAMRAETVGSTTVGSETAAGGGGAPCSESDGALFPDPAAPYLTDLADVMAGVSDWLADFLGVELRRPGAGGGGGGSDDGDRRRDGDCGDGNVSGGGGIGTPTATVPYDVSVMLDELSRYYAGAGDGSGDGGGGACFQQLPLCHRRLALEAVREAAVREPRRFLAYRLLVEGEVEAGEEPPTGAGATPSESSRPPLPPPPTGHVGTACTTSPVAATSVGSAAAAAAATATATAPPVRWLLLDLWGGFGTRYLLPPLGDDSGPSGGGGEDGEGTGAARLLEGCGGGVGGDAGTCRVAGSTGRGAVAAVVVGLQSGGGGGGGAGSGMPLMVRGSEFVVWELLHELGHAVHFLLAAAPPSPPPPEARSTAAAAAASGVATPATAAAPGQESGKATPPSGGGGGDAVRAVHRQGLRPLRHSLLPYQLPLELVELPSSLLERAAAEPEVMEAVMSRCRHVTRGQRPPREVCHALARAVRWSYYSPVSVQVQVVSSLLDQLLLTSPRRSPGAAQRLWPQLLATFAPSLPVGCSVQQLHSLARIASASGQGYAYVTAGYLADELWSACGFGAAHEAAAAEPREDVRQPREGRQLDPRQQQHQQQQQELQGQGQQQGPGGRQRSGRLVRRLLFERDASEQPPALLARLLGQVHSASAPAAAAATNSSSSSSGSGSSSGSSRDAVSGVGVGEGGEAEAAKAAAAEAARDGAAEGTGGGSAALGPLRLIRVAGGGCVPRVCGARVRRWTRGSVV